MKVCGDLLFVARLGMHDIPTSRTCPRVVFNRSILSWDGHFFCAGVFCVLFASVSNFVVTSGDVGVINEHAVAQYCVVGHVALLGVHA